MQNKINDPPPKAKAELRQWMLARLKQSTLEELKQADALICRRLRQLPLFNQANTVFAYAPMVGELDIWPILKELAASGRKLCLPRTLGQGIMEAREVDNLDDLPPDNYGIPTPPAYTRVVLPDEIDLILVPGLVFSQDLWRLGRGGGYYDRFLPGCPAFRLALARQMQIVGQIPHQHHDARMHALLSEEGFWE